MLATLRRLRSSWPIARIVMFAAVAFIAYFVARSIPQVFGLLGFPEFGHLLVSAALTVGSVALAGHAWHQILLRCGVRVQFRQDMRIYCYSLLGYVLPGGIWPTITRMSLYHQLGVNRVTVVVAGLVELIVSGVGGLMIYSVLYFTTSRLQLLDNPIIPGIMVLVAIGLMQPRVFRSVNRWLARRNQSGDVLPTTLFHFRDLCAWMALEAVVTILGGVSLFFTVTSLVQLSATDSFQFVAAWAAAVAIGNLLMWLPGTFIARDLAIVLVLLSSLPLPTAVAVAVFARAWTSSLLLVGAGVTWVVLDRPSRAWHSWR